MSAGTGFGSIAESKLSRAIIFLDCGITVAVEAHTIIVGGGVVGTACAHYLSLRGQRVTLIDQGRHGAACSRGNCGYVCPSHVLPLTEPGAIGMALRSLFQKNSAFRVKPRFDLALWSWLFHFARRCRTGPMLEAADGIQALLLSSMALYEELVEQPGIRCEWNSGSVDSIESVSVHQ